MAVATRAIRVLIVDDNAGTRTSVQRLLSIDPGFEVIATASDGRAAIELTGELQPDVVLMDVHLPEVDGIQATEEIRWRWPTTAVVVMSVDDQYRYLRRAMIAGAADFLTKPFGADELMASIRRAFERLVAGPRPVSGSIEPPPEAKPAKPGQVIAVFSPKGGVGRTTIATNLAVAIRVQTGRRVVVLDANLVFGDVGAMLNLIPFRTVLNLLPHGDDLTAELFAGALVEHHTGVKALLAPPRPEMAEIVQVEQMRAIVDQARRSFDYVVIDTPTSFHEVNLTLLDAADRILVVSTLELPALKNLKMLLETADALGYPADKTVLVVNRADSAGGIRVEDLEESVRKRVAVAIANDWGVATRAVNEGVPFVLSHRESQISRDLLALSSLIIGEPAAAPAPAPARRGLSLLSFAFR